MKKILSAGILAASFTLSTAHAGLIDRGNGLIYDDVLDVTWLQDANYAATSGYATANANGGLHSTPDNIQADGRMGWDAAMTWVDQLSYGGYDDWRLPTINVTDTDNSGQLDCDLSLTGGTDCGYNVLTANSELAHMFYNNLGNVAYYDTDGNGAQTGWDTLNTSFVDAVSGETKSFENLFRWTYWSGTEYAPNTNVAWLFGSDFGGQSDYFKYSSFYGWAVRSGDVVADPNAVPEPGTIALFGLGLLGLAVRRQLR